jgi:hypothetical protein
LKNPPDPTAETAIKDEKRTSMAHTKEMDDLNEAFNEITALLNEVVKENRADDKLVFAVQKLANWVFDKRSAAAKASAKR